ncbi:MAG: ferredoxin [Chlamydiae bacterium]|nr:MAG: ferredoxin [Chlamydiota bacterium]
MHETCSILILPDNRRIIVPENAYLHEALDRHGISLTAYCDGMGLCGKCIVQIKLAGGCLPPATEADQKFLSDDEIENGYRLACQWRVICNAEITIPEKSRVNHLNILTKGTGESPLKLSSNFSEDKPYGFAFDIGTTTVVGSLVDYHTGQTVGVSSYLNGQQKYGADVISRISHSINGAGLDELNSELVATINKIIEDVLGESKIPPDKIAEIVLTGNTVMLHSLHKESMENMAHLPFEPSYTKAKNIYAEETGIKIDSKTKLYSFPVISGFVGGDTVACMLSTDMDESSKKQLIIDIGTNGEVALGNKNGWTTTSAPAGPAFEGARISAGMRGANGAIEHVQITDAKMIIDVIGQQPPVGLCGTGLIDIAAELLNRGILDITGRINDLDELPDGMPDWLTKRIINQDGENAFLLFDPDTDKYIKNNVEPKKIYITQRDLRELQLAKAAVATACDLILKHENLKLEDVCCVLLAGAFGNYLRPANARRIGLIPNVPMEKIHFIGNAASTGAKRVLVSQKERKRVEKIAKEAEHIELAADPDFQMAYAEQMFYPDCAGI